MDTRVLVVDDEPHLVEIIASRLKVNGYDVQTAATGGEGLKRAETFKPQLILLDILMPDKDGYQVLRSLKANPKTKEIPVVILTVKKWGEDVKKAVSAGARDYVVKPFNSETLLEKIRKITSHG